jgi:hypothetical protein
VVDAHSSIILLQPKLAVISLALTERQQDSLFLALIHMMLELDHMLRQIRKILLCFGGCACA